MHRSHSAHELGKGRNPLQGYHGDSKSLLPLSTEEEEAERLYYGVVSASLTKQAFMILAKALSRRSPDAGAYLEWLITARGHQWPKVGSGAVKQKPRCLELFKGTGSIGRAFEKLGWVVTSVDIDPRFSPTVIADLLTWDYTIFPRDHYNFVWASPVCTHYSKAKTVGKRDLEGADRLVSKALEIIAYFGCNWAFENPQSGLLKTREVVKHLDLFDTSYCKFGFAYRKHTRIWTCLALSLHEPCSHRNPCSAMIGRRHPKTAQQSRRGSDKNDKENTCSQVELYSIPKGLCDAVATAANMALEETEDGDLGSPPAGTPPPPTHSFVSEELRVHPQPM